MAFWFPEYYMIAPGYPGYVEYWFTGWKDKGAQMATPVVYYSSNKGLAATGQGQRHDGVQNKFFYFTHFMNYGPETATFQIRGGGFT